MIAGIEFSRKAATGCHITSYRQLRVKDLPKVPTWRLEVESNQRPSAPNASDTTTQPTMPLSNVYCTQFLITMKILFLIMKSFF